MVYIIGRSLPVSFSFRPHSTSIILPFNKTTKCLELCRNPVALLKDRNRRFPARISSKKNIKLNSILYRVILLDRFIYQLKYSTIFILCIEHFSFRLLLKLCLLRVHLLLEPTMPLIIIYYHPSVQTGS